MQRSRPIGYVATPDTARGKEQDCTIGTRKTNKKKLQCNNVMVSCEKCNVSRMGKIMCIIMRGEQNNDVDKFSFLTAL